MSVLSGANVWCGFPWNPPEEPGALKNDSRQKIVPYPGKCSTPTWIPGSTPCGWINFIDRRTPSAQRTWGSFSLFQAFSLAFGGDLFPDNIQDVVTHFPLVIRPRLSIFPSGYSSFTTLVPVLKPAPCMVTSLATIISRFFFFTLGLQRFPKRAFWVSVASPPESGVFSVPAVSKYPGFCPGSAPDYRPALIFCSAW